MGGAGRDGWEGQVGMGGRGELCFCSDMIVEVYSSHTWDQQSGLIRQLLLSSYFINLAMWLFLAGLARMALIGKVPNICTILTGC